MSAARVWLLLLLGLLACGGSSSVSLPAGTFQPRSVSITGLPQFIAPSSTPEPTHTGPPTEFYPPIHLPPGGYVTYTPAAGVVYVCQGGFCFWATPTPFPGGLYSTPAYTVLPPSATPRPSYTPRPSPTACTSLNYHFGDEVFTDPHPDNLTLGLAVGNVRVHRTAGDPAQQVVVYQVEVRNLGAVDYLLFAPFQIYVAEVAGVSGGWYASEAAARAAGMTPADEMLDAAWIRAGERVSFDLYAFTPAGAVGAVAYILDPYANGYDGTIGGGNVAYWRSGSSPCGGRIAGTFTPPPNRTPAPTRTATATVASCAVTSSCITQIPGGSP